MNYSILFFPYYKTAKNTEEGEKVKLYCKINYNGRKEFSTGLEVDPNTWNKDAQKVAGKKLEYLNVNNKIREISEGIEAAFKLLEETGERFNAEDIYQVYTTKKVPRKSSEIGIMEGFDIWLKYADEHIDEEGYSPGTIRKHKWNKVLINKFIRHRYKAEDFPALNIDQEFVDELSVFSPGGKKLKGSYIKGILGTLDKVRKHLKIYKYVKTYEAIVPTTKIKIDQPTYKHIPDEVIEKLKTLSFENPYYTLAIDIALFQTECGHAYVDVMRLTYDNIGTDYVKGARKKTLRFGSKYSTPITELAQAIIDKYKYHPLRESNKVFPFITRRYYTKILENIEEQIGYHLSPHMFRHTFGTRMLNEGYSIEAVALMMGISPVMAQRVYAELLDKRLDLERKIIEERKRTNNK